MRVLMMPDYRESNPYQQLLAEALVGLGADISFTTGYRRVFPIWRAWRARPRADLVHLHWLSPYLRGANTLEQTACCIRLLLDVLLLRAMGVAVVWTIHNRVSHESRWPGLENWVQGRLARIVDRMIVHTNSGLRELRSDFPIPAGKASVIPHGNYKTAYGVAIDSRIARKNLGLPEQGKVYLCFGMLRPYKGIERLIREWPKAKAGSPMDTLLIAGKPIDDYYLALLTNAASQASNIIIRAGFVEDEQIPVLFSAADIVVLPFERILTSGSLLLAMSYAKPVIAPAFATIVETLGDADELLYDPEDPDGLRLALKQSGEMDVDSSGPKAEQIHERSDWDSIAKKTYDLYAELDCPTFGCKRSAPTYR